MGSAVGLDDTTSLAGLAVGVAIREAVGDGIVVDDTVTNIEGGAVGSRVGGATGAEEGGTVGLLTGAAVGMNEGENDGDREGA